jgi:phosphate transport system protein
MTLYHFRYSHRHLRLIDVIHINERVIMLITKQQPIASDLRMMISSLKIASDLERIGDNAASIANIRS